MSETAAIPGASRRLATARRRTVRSWHFRRRRERDTAALARLSDEDLQARLAVVRSQVAARHALLCEAVRRVLGVVPSRYDHRLSALLLSGQAAETPARAHLHLVVGMVATHLALEGRCCHVLSVGGTALEVADELGPLLDFLKIGWGRLGPVEPRQKRAALYRRQVVFATARDIALDLLREKVHTGVGAQGLRHEVGRLTAGLSKPGPRVLSGLDFALILDGEETLCRKALTMFVANAPQAEDVSATLMPEQALGVAVQFREDLDFRLDHNLIGLTGTGRERLRLLSGCLGTAWENAARSEIAIRYALEALYVWRRDTHYSVEDGVLQLDDPGLQDRQQEAGSGLSPEHFIAVKEGIAEERAERDIERMSLRTMIQQYPNRAALVADLEQHAQELRDAYGLRPGHAGKRRSPDRICLSLARLPTLLRRRWSGRSILPILIGGEAEEAEEVARTITSAGLSLASVNASLKAAASLAGLQVVEGFLWLEQPPAPNFAFLDEASQPPAAIELIAIGTGWFPELPGNLQVGCVQLAGKRLFPSGVGRWLLALSWLAQARVPGCGAAVALVVRQCLLRESAIETELRRRLHDFDRACRRAVSFLSNENEWN